MYLVLNPNAKPVNDILRSFKVGYIEVRQTPPSTQSANTPLSGLMAKRYWLDDCTDWQALINLASVIYFEQPFLGVISCHESTMLIAAYLRALFGLNGLQVDAILPFVNKYVMKQRFKKAKVATAKHELAHQSRLKTVKNDIIIKPIFGSSCLGTRLCDPEQAHKLAAFPAKNPLIIEEVIDVVNEYHIDSVIENAKFTLISAACYFQPPLRTRQGGPVGSFILDPHRDRLFERLVELNRRALQALGASDGVFHCEILESRQGDLLVGEVAHRPGGAGVRTAVELAYGVDLLAEYLRLSLEPNERFSLKNGDCIAQRSPSWVGWLSLPAPSGRIVDLTSYKTLEALPGVVKVDQHLSMGDTVEGEQHPYMSAYTIYFMAESQQNFDNTCQAILQAYYCKVI